MMRTMLGALCGLLLATGSAIAQTEQVTYYHTDAIGSVRMTTNAAGAVIARYDYLPFGEPWDSPTNPDVRRFAGKERDSESGLDYFGARYYRDQSGRFTTADPVLAAQQALADAQLWNRYVYVRNNPLRFTDPDGRCIWDLCIAETAAAIGVSQAAVVAAYATSAATVVIWNKREEIGSSIHELTRATGLVLRQAIDSLNRASRTDPYAYPEDYPQLDRSGKTHTRNRTLPDHVPENWTREMLQDASSTLRQSIKARNDEARRLGEDPAHRRRINEEERLLRQIEKALKEGS